MGSKRSVNVGGVSIGAGSPVSIQSMTNTTTSDVEATVKQIQLLESVGCEIIRCTIPDMESARVIPEIKRHIKIPFIADIHFDYKLAIASFENGADCIRINPGNIGGLERFLQVVDCAKANSKAIRIGVNSGSISKEFLEKYGVSERSLVESALQYIGYAEQRGFNDMKISLKASNVKLTIATYRHFSSISDYPLHVGVTEAGTLFSGMIKSAVGIGSLLADGIGDTIRVSLTAPPEEEIKVAKEILKSVGLRNDSVEIISCPTCGRTDIDLIPLAEAVANRLSHIKTGIKVAVMGCAVNGPGEAREADYGVAGGRGEGLIFKHGEILRKVSEEHLLDELVSLIESDLNKPNV